MWRMLGLRYSVGRGYAPTLRMFDAWHASAAWGRPTVRHDVADILGGPACAQCRVVFFPPLPVAGVTSTARVKVRCSFGCMAPTPTT